MILLPVTSISSHPAIIKISYAVLTYVLPSLAVFYVVLSGLWLVPDSFGGMYGNHDGHGMSWNTRGILEWGGFLDFSPFSPLVGTGSLFAPYLPWLNPGALALAIPGASAAAASRVDAHLSGGIVGDALSALPPSRVFAGAIVPRNSTIRLHILHSFRADNARSLVHARAHERPFDRHDERGDDRTGPGGT